MGRTRILHVSIVLFLCLLANFNSGVSSANVCEDQITYEMKLKLVKESINQVRTLFPKCRDADEDVNKCGKRDNALGHLNLIADTLKGLNVNIEGGGGIKDCPKCPDPQVIVSSAGPVDCSEIYQLGHKKSGVYTIYPKSRSNPNISVSAYCDMDTDGGGWTVIQRRANYSEQTDFFRDWEDYKTGFGDVKKDFWLGNENIYTLTNQGVYSLRIDMKNAAGEYRYSQHNSFWIGDEWSNYVLHVQNFTGNVTNDLETQNKMMFSTKDRQNDGHRANDKCSDTYHGAWWYPPSGCGLANLNAMYMPGIDNHNSNWWYYWTGFKGLLFSEMKIRHRYPSINEKQIV